MPRRLNWRDRRAVASLKGELQALDEDIAAARDSLRRLDDGPLSGGRGTPEPPPPLLYGESVPLPDGAEIMVRSVLPQDADRLAFDLDHLSALSRYRRFRASVSRLSPNQLRDATHVDHVTHEALVALSPDAHDDIGLARFAVDPRDPKQAEVDLVVADGWQHRGVGRVLIEKIAARARAAGVERFTATMLVGNEAARATVEKVADIVAEESDGAVAVVTAQLRTS